MFLYFGYFLRDRLSFLVRRKEPCQLINIDLKSLIRFEWLIYALTEQSTAMSLFAASSSITVNIMSIYYKFKHLATVENKFKIKQH